MATAVDLTGLKFGRVSVLGYIGSWRKKRRYRCQCDCGKELTATSGDLRWGKQTSCGCAKRERIIAINAARTAAKAVNAARVGGGYEL